MVIQDFKDKQIGSRAFIIGKGPSLDTLEVIRNDLWGGVVFCLNESIHKFESLGVCTPTYVVQQDSELEYDCIPDSPTVIHFMNAWQHIPNKPRHLKEYVTQSPWSPQAVVYRPSIFGESPQSLSAIIALKIAQLMGIKHVTFCCFDALVNDYAGSPMYAECVGKQRVGSHRSHNKVIMAEAKRLMESVKTLHPRVAIVEK